jgi:hypothetical protein
MFTHFFIFIRHHSMFEVVKYYSFFNLSFSVTTSEFA